MTIQEFASKHKLRIKRDEEGEQIVMAKHGQIYDYGRGQFGVMFLTNSVGKWNNRRKECEAAGMKLIQDGDTEGTLLFDPQDREQSKVAIRTVGARQKRQLTPEAKARAIENAAKARQVKDSLHSEGIKQA